MDIYFFYKRANPGSWYDVTIEAWEENSNTYRDGKKESSFLQLERMRIHCSKDPASYHSARFDHDFSSRSCFGHNASSLVAFRLSLDEEGFLEVNHSQYERLKRVMLRIYRKYPRVNFTERLLKDSPVTNIIL